MEGRACTIRQIDRERTRGATADARRLYSFDTHSGKALLVKSSWTDFPGWIDFYEAIKPRAEKGEIWVTSGRFNET